MISKIAPVQPAAADTHVSATPDAGGPAGKRPQAAAPSAPDVVKAEAPAEPLLRLEIKDSGHGRYIYTLTDRNTGRTVVEIPREAVSEIGSDANYTAGAVVRTKA